MRMSHHTSGSSAVHLGKRNSCAEQLLTAGRSIKIPQYLFESHGPMLTRF
jgi:hypothetical protein